VQIATENPAVHLRPWTKGDYAALVRYGNNKAVWRGLTDMFPHPYTHDRAVEWVQIAAQSPSLFLAIDLNGEAVGGAGVIAREGMEIHTGQFGYWVGEPHWGKGLATVCARALKDHAFSNPKYIRLEAPVFAWNIASMRVLEKAGFTREGILRKSVFKDGQVIDQVMYAAIRDA
jgi:RimJ/RimL family protein N-acetyltransferase